MNQNFPNPPCVNVCTELRQAYEAVERVEILLAGLRDSPLSGSYLRDTPASGYWSPEVFRIFGLDWAEEAPPLDAWISMVLCPDLARTTEAAQKAFQERRNYETEFQIRLRNGSVKILHSRAHPVSGRFGYDFVLLGIVTDITAEVQAQATISAAREEIRRCSLVIDGAEIPTNLDAETRIFNLDQNVWRVVRGGLSHAQIRRILRLIEERLPEKVSVKEMAREAGLSESHFSRTFKQITGETPHQFALSMRLERARAALADSSATNIANVAAECGFFDQAHFTRQFQKRFGITPGEAVRSLTVNRLPTARQMAEKSKS